MGTANKKMDFDFEQMQRYKLLSEANSIPRIDYENKVLQYQTSKANYQNAITLFQRKKL